MADALKGVKLRSTAQTEPTPGRTDEVKNDAGGYAFQLDDWGRFDRFLILGVDGGTYYVDQATVLTDSLSLLIKLVEQDGIRFVDRLVEVSDQGRAPKNQPALFALAVAASAKDPATRKYALDNLPKVARIGTHLFQFATYIQNMRGWGRQLRRAVAQWYTEKDVDKVAFQAIKYRQREGWSHRDLLRLSHPKSDAHADVFDWIAHGQGSHPLIDAFERVQVSTKESEVISLVTDHRLPWEALPDQFLNSPKVWDALLDSVGQTALLRQLPRLTRIGLIKPMSDASKRIVDMLTDKDRVEKGRIHPIAVLNALRTYAEGYSLRGSSEWDPDKRIVDALDDMFYLSFKNVTAAEKRTLLALDVSGSMAMHRVAGSPGLTPREAAAAMAMVTIATEPITETVAFSHEARPSRGSYNYGHRAITTLPLSSKMRLGDVIAKTSGLPFSGTDCALPMLWAMKNKIEVDTFQVYTDNETWAGDVKPFEALRQYRQWSGIDARLIVFGLEGRPFTIADPSDPGMLDVVGLDSSAPQIAADFSGGRI